MSAVTIIIRAKNEASAAFSKVKGDITGFSQDSAKAMTGIRAANEALAKAMRGDLVGAVASASQAFKALWAVIVANPMVAVLAGIAAAGLALVKLAAHQKEAAHAS
jgi:hypothetical protein